MKDKATKNGVKKPIFKKWWFWVIVVVILAAIFGNTGAKKGVEVGAQDAINSMEQQATLSVQQNSRQRKSKTKAQQKMIFPLWLPMFLMM